MKDAPYGVKDAREGDVDGWKDSMDLSAIQVTVRACLAEEDCGTAQGATCAGVYAEQLLQALQVSCWEVSGCHPLSAFPQSSTLL